MLSQYSNNTEMKVSTALSVSEFPSLFWYSMCLLHSFNSSICVCHLTNEDILHKANYNTVHKAKQR